MTRSFSKRCFCVGIVVIAAVLAWYRIPAFHANKFLGQELNRAWAIQNHLAHDAPHYESQFISQATDKYVHAASVTELPGGQLLAAWLSGSREGASDVNIMGAKYDPQLDQWSSNFVLVTLKQAQSQLDRYLRKLGNPLLVTLPNGRIWLFYVTVSYGGWAGSAINATHSDDNGGTWSSSKRLITSPFFNLSTLVKGSPLFYKDGSIGIPVYHEFIGKFGELLRVTSNGELLEKKRLSYGMSSLQPVIVPSTNEDATALMRFGGNAHGRVLVTRTEDGGDSWDTTKRTTIPNPNSALTALRLNDGSLISVLNDLENSRFRLGLYRSTDEGVHWRHIHYFDGVFDGTTENYVENACKGDACADTDSQPLFPQNTFAQLVKNGFLTSAGRDRQYLLDNFLENLDQRMCRSNGCRFRYDYPYIIRSSEGEYHLFYTWNKSFIKHVKFNQTWLESLI